ncbi:hypothetical protein APC42_10725 [Acinetobacter pittii]|uniref:hypothetical protein n=1 Tax=Acinetobacter pittii TaxID=48296 RepID=UPI00070D488F|nr:hypothetical protein [Acinetobacter pittii]KRI47609.1 hypothetical protein APC42_10725 [Acinetobacter pittii]OTL85420.1 hypothetical protein B9X62_03820 [Acinetobacter pittii]
MIKALSLITICISMVACASVPRDTSVQLLDSDSTLINGCKKLGPINTDTRGNPFNFADKADSEFKRIAKDKYGADSAVITYRSNLPAGRVVMQGTALKCY